MFYKKKKRNTTHIFIENSVMETTVCSNHDKLIKQPQNLSAVRVHHTDKQTQWRWTDEWTNRKVDMHIIIGFAPAKRVEQLLNGVSPTPMIVWYSEGRKPQADEKRSITSILPFKTVPQYLQCTIKFYTILIMASISNTKICNFNRMKYLLFVSFHRSEYKSPMFTVRTCGSWSVVLLIAGLLLQQLLTTSLWHQPKGQ